MHAEGLENKISPNEGEKIQFSGHTWTTKDSYGKHTGPGNNYFSGTKENVWVDQDGKLHMRITYRNDKWYCPEVKLTETLGYGQYYFYLDPLPQPLDKDVVIGLFLYNREDSANFHNEIDIEFSTWGKDSSLNSQYVVQPKEDQAYRFNTDLSKPSKHLMELQPKKVTFKSFQIENGKENQIAKNKEKPDYDYYSMNEKVSINVWLYHTSEPSNLKEFEVVISKFEHVTKWYDKFMYFEKKKTTVEEW
jgi:hypothetical protein